MEKIILTKPYERDFSLAIEEFWARGFLKTIIPMLGVPCPHKLFEIFYVTEENLQIWEHRQALDWFLDQLLEHNKKGTQFVEAGLAEYVPLLRQLEEFWHKGPTADLAELLKYRAVLEKAAPLFSLWYYPGTDERTPEDVLKIVLEVRRTDEFFARNDIYIKDCAELLGAERAFANLITADEFPNIPSNEVLRARAKGMVSLDGLEVFVSPLAEFAAAHPEMEFVGLTEKPISTREVRGQVGYKGVLQGKVRVIKNQRQMHSMVAGEIIVSPMTSPDFLPAMRLASAFVTDEGGIMCHAAIVAREMKKPCIIGTKFATQIFRDGDMVEVDAEKGIVRKI